MKHKITTVNNYTIVDDKEKGYIHCEPLPSNEELNHLYKEEYHREGKNGYVGRNIEDIEWWETLYQDKYETFTSYLDSESNKILDVGCGGGAFLLHGKDQGWDCYGIEPSKQATLYAQSKGLNVINSQFSKDLYASDELFDVIHMHHVLEHMTNPTQLIKDVYSLLRVGGLFCVAVPNDFSPFQKILSENLGFKSWWLTPPQHVNYFTLDSLSKLVEDNGFTIVKKESSFPMELFLLLGDDYIQDPSLGRKMHNKRKNFDLILSKHNNQLKRDLYQAFANLNIGRDIILYAIKK